MQVRLKLKVMLMSERTEKMTARTEQDSTAIAFRGQHCSFCGQEISAGTKLQ
jgi:hypothetical protein